MENFEKVEAYFNNELTDSEKIDFIKDAETNADLKSEFNFQNEVIQGIKEARKAELKAMLNNVPIAAVGTAASGLYKMFVGGATLAILGTALWYYLDSSRPSELANEQMVIVEEPLKESNVLVEPKNIENTEEITLTETQKATPEKSAKDVSVNKDKLVINTPNLPSSQDEFDGKTLPEENLEIPNDLSKAPINLSTKVDVEIKLKKKYSFHYQYSQQKLVLYGNFEEGLFEVIELNKGSKSEVYLYYKSNFYYIKDNSDSIVPLKEVDDNGLKLKLERLR